MKTKLLVVALALATFTGTAWAVSTYTFINSNNGASLSGEQSTKKAGMRGAIMQLTQSGSNFFTCPNGESCHETQCAPPGQGAPCSFVTNTECIDLNPAPGKQQNRQCILKLENNQTWLIMRYKQAYNIVEYFKGNDLVWTLNISQHKLTATH